MMRSRIVSPVARAGDRRRPRDYSRQRVLWLVRGVSDRSRAGFFVDVPGSISEVRNPATLVARQFPLAFLRHDEAAAVANFLRTLERDLPQLGITTPATTMRRFWNMIAHFHGQIWNAADLARSLGAAEPTARRYLDTLTSMFLVRQLPPWFENLGSAK
jgi:hypothetical protein